MFRSQNMGIIQFYNQIKSYRISIHKFLDGNLAIWLCSRQSICYIRIYIIRYWSLCILHHTQEEIYHRCRSKYYNRKMDISNSNCTYLGLFDIRTHNDLRWKLVYQLYTDSNSRNNGNCNLVHRMQGKLNYQCRYLAIYHTHTYNLKDQSEVLKEYNFKLLHHNGMSNHLDGNMAYLLGNHLMIHCIRNHKFFHWNLALLGSNP